MCPRCRASGLANGWRHPADLCLAVAVQAHPPSSCGRAPAATTAHRPLLRRGRCIVLGGSRRGGDAQCRAPFDGRWQQVCCPLLSRGGRVASRRVASAAPCRVRRTVPLCLLMRVCLLHLLFYPSLVFFRFLLSQLGSNLQPAVWCAFSTLRVFLPSCALLGHEPAPLPGGGRQARRIR